MLSGESIAGNRLSHVESHHCDVSAGHLVLSDAGSSPAISSQEARFRKVPSDGEYFGPLYSAITSYEAHLKSGRIHALTRETRCSDLSVNCWGSGARGGWRFWQAAVWWSLSGGSGSLEQALGCYSLALSALCDGLGKQLFLAPALQGLSLTFWSPQGSSLQGRHAAGTRRTHLTAALISVWSLKKIQS